MAGELVCARILLRCAYCALTLALRTAEGSMALLERGAGDGGVAPLVISGEPKNSTRSATATTRGGNGEVLLRGRV
jgi:hypothetical protein